MSNTTAGLESCLSYVRAIYEAAEKLLSDHDFSQGAYKIDLLVNDVCEELELQATEHRFVDDLIRVFVSSGKHTCYYSQRGVGGGICKQGVSKSPKPIRAKKTVSAEVKAEVIAAVDAKLAEKDVAVAATVSVVDESDSAAQA
jgi:hypothetical protein